mmetsp:Transcript_10636/g.21757  ORF Transcript_10636/g.21757 Transcript_10636/m.21757 type:complete len:116 (+) Transcript_10636:1624-1971(+)
MILSLFHGVSNIVMLLSINQSEIHSTHGQGIIYRNYSRSRSKMVRSWSSVRLEILDAYCENSTADSWPPEEEYASSRSERAINSLSDIFNKIISKSFSEIAASSLFCSRSDRIFC